MWHKGEIEIPGTNTIARYEVKSYEDGSEYGIDNGRISKLTVWINEKIVINYDRGWDLKPDKKDESMMFVYNEIIKKYN